jgi:hypothetical protein
MSVQGDLLTAPSTLSDLLAGESRCARLARFFIEHRGEWIDGTTLQQIAGVYAWRTRVSDLRKRPWLLDIENRMRWTGRVVASEYRLVIHGD